MFFVLAPMDPVNDAMETPSHPVVSVHEVVDTFHGALEAVARV